METNINVMKFNIGNCIIQFDKEIDIIVMGRKIYSKLAELCKDKYFLRQFIKINEKFISDLKNCTTDERDDLYDTYQEDIDELSTYAFGDIRDTVYNILKDIGVNINNDYIYGSYEIYGSSVEGVRENYKFYYDLDYEDEKSINEFIEYNNKLKNSKKESALFCHHIMLELMREHLITILGEYIYIKHPEIDKYNDVHDDVNPLYEMYMKKYLSFDLNNVFYYSDFNCLRDERKEIEEKNDKKRIDRYIQTLKISPYNLEAYMYIVDQIGDQNGELSRLYNAVLGDDALTEYKINLINEKFKENYPQSVISDIKSREEAEKVNTFLIGLKDYYSIDRNLDIDNEVQLMMKSVDTNEKTVNGKLYTSKEEADVIRNCLQEFESKIDKSTLLNMKLSIDKIDKDSLNPEIIPEWENLNNEFLKREKECKECKEKYIKKLLIKALIIYLIIVAMLLLFALGIIGIIIDVILFIAILVVKDDIKEIVSNKKQYVEYEKYFNK